MRAPLLCVAVTLASAASLAAAPVNWPSASQVTAILQQTDTDLGGYEITGAPASYTKAAPIILKYDYLWSVGATFTATKHGGAKIVVQLHRFQTDLDAFGALSTQRDPKVPGKAISLDRPTPVLAAYWRGNQLHAWRGPFYIAFLPTKKGSPDDPAVVELARTLLGKFPPMRENPPIFAIPAQRGMIIETAGFQRREVFGRAALRNAFKVTYGRRYPNKLDATMQLVLFDAHNASGASQTFAEVESYLREAGIARPVPALGQGAFTMRHPTHGHTYVMRQGRYVVMLQQVKMAQAAEGVLRQIGKNIRLSK